MATKPTTKQPVCLTCHGEVDWRFNATTRAWQAFDHDSEKLHKCEDNR